MRLRPGYPRAEGRRLSLAGHCPPCAEGRQGGAYTKARREGGVRPHFIRGLGFPLHPFVRGLVFYCGLDFHNLPPNSFMHISAYSSPFVRPSCGFNRTSAYGSRLSTSSRSQLAANTPTMAEP